MSTNINITVNSEELLFNSRNSIKQNRINLSEQAVSKKKQSETLSAWNDKISKQGFNPRNKQIYGAKQAYAKESLAESQRIRNPVASYKRKSVPSIPFQINTGPDGPYVGSTLTLDGIPCGTFEVDWKIDGVIDESLHNDIDFYVREADAGHDIEAVITCSDGEVYTTDPVNAGTATLPISYSGNVKMYLVNTYAGCYDYSCAEPQSSYLLGEFTAADHRTLYYSHYDQIAGTQCGSGFGPGPCPQGGPECGYYPTCQYIPYLIEVSWRYGIIGVLYPHGFAAIAPGSSALPSRLIAVPS